MHTSISGVAHYCAADDGACLKLIREQFRQMAAPGPTLHGEPPAVPSDNLYDILPSDHRLPYRIEDIIERIVDGAELLEFQPDFAPEMICCTARLNGRLVGIIANRRGFLKTPAGARVGGIVYTESARKVAYFVENAERHQLPLIYLQDVSGFMVGVEAEVGGIIRAGAQMVEAMACAAVPKIVVTLNHASGAGYYAMAGQGFDPTFTFSWPTARIGVMEGDSAIQAIYGPELQKLKSAGTPIPPALQEKIARTRADYDRWLDAKYAAARGHCDALIDPKDTRKYLDMALTIACAHPRTEHVPVQLLGS